MTGLGMWDAMVMRPTVPSWWLILLPTVARIPAWVSVSSAIAALIPIFAFGAYRVVW